jgi:hypothetical protein
MQANQEFHHNHYVPEWYQRRFMPPGSGKYWYLDLNPEQIVQYGHKYTCRSLLRWGPDSCFAENGLYTTKWGTEENVDIEKFFFGRVDSNGKSAVEFFANFEFDHPDQLDAFNNLMVYMSVQKLRTPKGIGWLGGLTAGLDRNERLILLQRVQNMFCATWTECVWLIADATKSDTKFIISDHPVTVYNRACFPGSTYCQGFNDPDIRVAATHTYFPLSIDKLLILTNLAWVRNPYQNERKLRPNPQLFRNTIMNLQDIQMHRSLSELYLPPVEDFITKAWLYEAENWGLKTRSLGDCPWVRFPAVRMLQASSPKDWELVAKVVTWPFDPFLATQLIGEKPGEERRPTIAIAPFETDPEKWASLPWIFADNGESVTLREGRR